MIDTCRFCQKEKNKILPSFYRCFPCGMTSLYNLNTLDIVEEIYVRVLDKTEYHLKIDYMQRKSSLYYYHPNIRDMDILNVNHIIIASPDTVINKIKVYLLFL
ncbi:MAG TPA: hypothetical protein VII94_04170 [Candidatus Saccharimonadales bacterium]